MAIMTFGATCSKLNVHILSGNNADGTNVVGFFFYKMFNLSMVRFIVYFPLLVVVLWFPNQNLLHNSYLKSKLHPPFVGAHIYWDSATIHA